MVMPRNYKNTLLPNRPLRSKVFPFHIPITNLIISAPFKYESDNEATIIRTRSFFIQPA